MFSFDDEERALLGPAGQCGVQLKSNGSDRSLTSAVPPRLAKLAARIFREGIWENFAHLCLLIRHVLAAFEKPENFMQTAGWQLNA